VDAEGRGYEVEQGRRVGERNAGEVAVAGEDVDAFALEFSYAEPVVEALEG
jgi:hypothetical protein